MFHGVIQKITLAQFFETRCIALNDTQSQSYGTSLAIWDHTVLPATRHKWTRPA